MIPSDKEMDDLVNWLDSNGYSNIKCFVILAMTTGLRINEILSINRSSFINNVILINGKDKYVKVNKEIEKEIINIYMNNDNYFYLFESVRTNKDKPISQSYVNRILVKACCDLGFTERVSANTIRKFWARKEFYNGVSLSSLKKKLGKSSLSTTRDYLGI